MLLALMVMSLCTSHRSRYSSLPYFSWFSIKRCFSCVDCWEYIAKLMSDAWWIVTLAVAFLENWTIHRAPVIVATSMCWTLVKNLLEIRKRYYHYNNKSHKHCFLEMLASEIHNCNFYPGWYSLLVKKVTISGSL